MLWKTEWVKKYENHYKTNNNYYDNVEIVGNCVECGKETKYRATDMETGMDVSLCWSCYEEKDIPNANVPYPIRVIYTRIIRNELGMGGFYARRPSQKFFIGLSGAPHRNERINFRAHELYMTRERAKAEGFKLEE